MLEGGWLTLAESTPRPPLFGVEWMSMNSIELHRLNLSLHHSRYGRALEYCSP